MTTTTAFEDVEAAVQVAHALSTNELTRVYDFFTAVDDLKKADDDADAGAGMIGDVELNSSTYYKYFNIHWEGLVKNLGGDKDVASKAVAAFIEAAVTAQPSGKQNSTAAHQLPDFVLVEITEKNLPINYANAFLKPAQQGYKQTLVQNAITKLYEYTQRVRKAYGLNGRCAFFSTEKELAIDNAQKTEMGVRIDAPGRLIESKPEVSKRYKVKQPNFYQDYPISMGVYFIKPYICYIVLAKGFPHTRGGEPWLGVRRHRS